MGYFVALPVANSASMPRLWTDTPLGIYPLADGKRIVWLEEQYATILDTADGRDLGGIKRPTERKSGLRYVTPDGRLFYIRGDEIRVWSLTTHDAEPPRTIPGRRNVIRCFDLSAR